MNVAGAVRLPAFPEALDLGLIRSREDLSRDETEQRSAPDFKAHAIDLYRSSEARTIADVARELASAPMTFRK
jgi:hypothetical protein